VSLPKTLSDLLVLPTAPFVESAVMNYLTQAVAGVRGVATRFDRWGNLVVRYCNAPPKGVKPIVFTAHTDHPGFVALKMLAPKRLRASFRGWVEPEYFLGTGVRFWSADKWVLGEVAKITKSA